MAVEVITIPWRLVFRGLKAFEQGINVFYFKLFSDFSLHLAVLQKSILLDSYKSILCNLGIFT